MAGPGVSATYHFVWMHLGFAPFPGLHISWYLSSPYCGIHVPLYGVSLVVLVSNPISSPVRFIGLGYSPSNTLRGMILPPTLVLTFTWTEALVLPSQLPGRCTTGICFCFPGSFDIINHDFIWIISHIRVRPDKLYIDFIILAISSSISMMSVYPFFPWWLLAFLGVLCFPILFVERGTFSAL